MRLLFWKSLRLDFLYSFYWHVPYMLKIDSAIQRAFASRASICSMLKRGLIPVAAFLFFSTSCDKLMNKEPSSPDASSVNAAEEQIELERIQKEKEEQEMEQARLEKLKEQNLKMQKELAEEIDLFKKRTAEQITENSLKIEKMREALKVESKKLQEIQKQEILLLEKANEALKVKIADFKEESKENWQSFKKAFDAEMEVLKKNLTDFGKKEETDRH